MTGTMTSTLTQRIAGAHANIVTAASEADDDQFTRWLAPNVPSVGWHVWHIARWADRVHARLPCMANRDTEGRARPEIWEVESLAAKWNLDRPRLGYGETGMEMGDAAASALRLPDRDTVIAYARRAFAAAEAACSATADEYLAVRGPDVLYAGRMDRERTVGEAMIGHLSHANRHLGMIEGIRPLLLHKPGSITF